MRWGDVVVVVLEALLERRGVWTERSVEPHQIMTRRSQSLSIRVLDVGHEGHGLVPLVIPGLDRAAGVGSSSPAGAGRFEALAEIDEVVVERGEGGSLMAGTEADVGHLEEPRRATPVWRANRR